VNLRGPAPDLNVRAALVWSACVLLLRLSMLSATPFANGLDGYANAVQVLSLDRTGHLMMVDDSPVFWLLEAINGLIRDPVLAVKLGSALFGALLGLAVRWFLLQAGAGRDRAFWGMVLCGLSPTLTFMSVDYVKNLGALVVFWLAAGWTVRLFFAKSDAGDWLLAAALYLLTWSSHRVTAVLLALFVVALAVQRWGKRPLFWLAFTAAAAALSVVVVLARGSLSVADGARLAFSWPSLPWLSAAFRDQLPWPVTAELTLWALTAWAWVPRLLRPGSVFRALGVLGIVLFLPVWDLSALDLGFRLFSNGVPVAVALLVLGWPEHWAPRWPWGLLAAACLLPAVRGVYRVENDPPYRLYQRVTASIELPSGSLLIAHAGLNHLYTYTHGLKEAMNYLPEWPLAPELLWRVSHGVLAAEYAAFIPEALTEGRVRALAGSYVLIREDAFQTFLDRAGPERRESLRDWYNPYQVRPEFLLQKNR
jgi:hypothetical protein